MTQISPLEILAGGGIYAPRKMEYATANRITTNIVADLYILLVKLLVKLLV